jgi:ADP-ribosylation factor-like protein 2
MTFIVDKRIQALDLTSIKSHNWTIMSCSAVTGYNLVEGLDWVVSDVAGRLYYSTLEANAADVTVPLSRSGLRAHYREPISL